MQIQTDSCVSSLGTSVHLRTRENQLNAIPKQVMLRHINRNSSSWCEKMKNKSEILEGYWKCNLILETPVKLFWKYQGSSEKMGLKIVENVVMCDLGRATNAYQHVLKRKNVTKMET